jgi:UDP-glucose 4-epimerase
MGSPRKIIVFSRDEAKQHDMRVDYLKRRSATDEVTYRNFEQVLEFRIGDVRDFHSVSGVLADADVVFNAAAMKQVPACEYFPFEAVETNIIGPNNIVRAIREHRLDIELVVGISTDKACKPVNVMGMTKSIQERVVIRANLDCPATRFVCVRYGNVLASRGSVIPLFHEQIRCGGPVTITTSDMTRFLLSLQQAVDVIFAVVRDGKRGETFIPRVPACKVVDIAEVLVDGRPIPVVVTGIRPGEKVHEILISDEESERTVLRGDYFAIRPILPELRPGPDEPRALEGEFSSSRFVMPLADVRTLLERERLLVGQSQASEGELLR